MRFRLSFIAFLVASLLLALPALSAAAPGKGKPLVGARSLGDPLLPQLGNGGYDVDALPDRARLRPGRERLRLGGDDDRRHRDAEAEGVQPRLPGPRRLRGDRERPRGRLQPGRGDPGPEHRPGRHPADEAGGRRRSRRRGRRRAATSPSWSTTRARRSRSPTRTRRSRAGSPRAIR